MNKHRYLHFFLIGMLCATTALFAQTNVPERGEIFRDHSISDESNEFDEWVELYYNGAEPLYLGDKYLSDNINIPNKWKMPDLTISQGEYLLF